METDIDKTFVEWRNSIIPISLVEKIDRIYYVVDSMLRKEEFEILNTWIGIYPTNKRHVDELLAVLTATLPAKSKLPNREIIIKEIERELKLRDEWEENLLQGLE